MLPVSLRSDHLTEIHMQQTDPLPERMLRPSAAGPAKKAAQKYENARDRSPWRPHIVIIPQYNLVLRPPASVSIDAQLAPESTFPAAGDPISGLRPSFDPPAQPAIRLGLRRIPFL